MGLGASTVFLVYPGLEAWRLAGVLAGAFGGALVFYWLGATLAFATRNGGVLAGLIPLVFFGSTVFDLHVLLERLVVELPFAVLAAGVTCSAAAWVKLGRGNPARRYCSTPWIGFLDSFF